VSEPSELEAEGPSDEALDRAVALILAVLDEQPSMRARLAS
jgi:hypothetical protein